MTARDVVLVDLAGDETAARQLARRLGIPIVPSDSDAARRFDLILDQSGLSIRCYPPDGGKPVRVDFTGGKAAWRLGQPELVARAVGAPKHLPLRVMDATAGLGRDAFVLASKGCQVTLYERHPVVHALLEDGLRRAMNHPATREIAARMSLVGQDAAEVLSDEATVSPDVVYIDPMFPPRRKSGLVKKDMRLFHELVEADSDSARLLERARRRARRRVVVKRPRKGEPLDSKPPDFSVSGRSVRFDVYLARRSGP